MNKELLTIVYRKLNGTLLSRARNLLSNEEDARDILQEAFYRLWKNDTAVQSPDHAAGLLIRTIRNLSVDSYRHNHNITEVALTDVNATAEIECDSTGEHRELYDDVNKIICQYLSNRDREILLHRDRDEWDYSELAEKYNLSEANVRMIVARARKTVREIYRTRQ